MRAIVFDQPGDATVLRVGWADAPSLGRNDLRIRVHATAVNRADILQRQGLYPPPRAHRRFWVSNAPGT